MPLTQELDRAISALPFALQAPVRSWCERLCDLYPAPTGAAVTELVRIVAISEFAAKQLLKDWPEYCARLESMAKPCDRATLTAFADEISHSDESGDEVKARLRRERNRRMLGILWRDASGVATVPETLEALSDLADQMLRAALNFAERQLALRFGRIPGAGGEPVPLLMLGMGKLGGGELNFSSDVDLIFIYPNAGAGDGMSDGQRSVHAQSYFDRLSRTVVALMDDLTEDGFVFRMDTRLRPFGDSGPPVISFAALESYLLKHGRDWERYAYVKARLVGERPSQAVSRELFDDLITPFVYRGYLDYGVFEALREMHGLIVSEARKRELRDNIKLGPGGIREIEFIVQSLQLVRGSNRPELQGPGLLQVLPLLADGRNLSAAAAKELTEAYLFLRRLENYIQAMRDQQSHDLPVDPVDQARLALAMGCTDYDSLQRELDRVRASVAAHFADIAFRERPPVVESNEALLAEFEKLWASRADVGEWQSILAANGFVEAESIAGELVSFRQLPATRSISSQAAARLQDFVPQLLLLARACPRPDLAVSRCLTVVGSILRRSAYLALLNENRMAAERVVTLCGQSAYITAQLARYPVLLDELLDPSLVAGPYKLSDLTEELRRKLARHKGADNEEKMEQLARFQRATMFRVAVSDFTGKLQIMQVSDSLTFLAESILAEALAIAWDELVTKHGKPEFRKNGKRCEAGFGVIAYGKLGGLELSYGSDLDIVFLHDSAGTEQQTNGERPLENTMFFSRLVRRLVHFLTTRTNTGALYEVDTRLRPSGRKGLLVTSVEAFSRYQEEHAWTWEHQALLRARAVAGSANVAAEFQRIRSETLTRRVKIDKLREDVLSMRKRMRAELDNSNSEMFNLKHGNGGIGDIEFIVQYLVLTRAAAYPSVIEFTDNIRQLNALAECGALSLGVASDLQQVYRHFRRRQHHLSLNGEAPLVPDSEFAPERLRVGAAWQQVFGA
ncbi:MAG TPA: bifunctional [glutamate--ammonia ligase]-adenylyl-L-tyrosine phosphorylase/[glutamate--ammonia-ligase] adenylyltransferase [Woeseiaceae bacterium]|nr:bifunctional [glutamate--ammonia ligase]-adenylyl-L-tyrosine phosphorylase/[glutamate--ammonia-ligase] adenylyltransferase [Woeseiaceae bacterium]